MVFDPHERIESTDPQSLRRADVVFVLDVSGSMGNSLEALKETITEVGEIFLSERVQVRLGIVEFRGTTDEHEASSFYINRIKFSSSQFTENTDEFRDAISKLTATGGGYWEENSMQALMIAAKSDWQEGPHRVIILVTDAPPLGSATREEDSEWKGVTSSHADYLTSNKIDQLFILAPENELLYYATLFDARAREDIPIDCETHPITSDKTTIKKRFLEIAKNSSSGIARSSRKAISAISEEVTQTYVTKESDEVESAEDPPQEVEAAVSLLEKLSANQKKLLALITGLVIAFLAYQQ